MAALGSANAAQAGVGAAGAQRQALRSNQEVTERQVKRIDRLRGEGGATESDLDRASSQADQLSKQLKALDCADQRSARPSESGAGFGARRRRRRPKPR